MLLLACLFLASSLVTAEIRSAGWRPIAPQGEPGGHLAISYHTLHTGGGPSLPLQHYHQLGDNLAGKGSLGQEHCALYKVSFIQDLYFQVMRAGLKPVQYIATDTPTYATDTNTL
jgi:hypothetical protein